jgi:hypothetical protein
MEPSELLDAARRMLDEPNPSTVSAWGRAAALLARQALEAALAEFWGVRAPGVENLNMRAQLNCARAYLPAVATDLSHVWHALSRATHHRPYELDPTREELDTLLARSGAIVQSLRALEAAVSSGSTTAG